MNTSSLSPLQVRISERIQTVGALSFAEYMRMALYEPEYGYYTSGPHRMGWEGDYYTSSDVTNLFAYCMGRQLDQIWSALGFPTPFVVIEQGAGRGTLGQEIQNWAAQYAPLLHAVLRYESEDIKVGQDAITTGSTQTPSVIISNELVDAFPIHIVEKRGDELYELYVAAEQGRLQAFLSEPSSEEVATYLDEYKIPWRSYPDGWRAEINLDAKRWIAQAAQRIMGNGPRKRRGFLLTIDYGEKARELYTPNRRYGTLACYYQHQLSDNPLLRPGEQDITAHVNFSALINEGRQQGMRLHSYTTQSQWLTNLGIYEELGRIRSAEFAEIDSDRASNKGQVALLQWYNLRQRVATLTDPSGMGNFKVLILKR